MQAILSVLPSTHMVKNHFDMKVHIYAFIMLTALMAKWLISVTDCSVKRRVFEPSMNAGFQCSARSLLRSALHDAIT